MAVINVRLEFPRVTYTFLATKPGVYSSTSLMQTIITLPASTKNKMVMIFGMDLTGHSNLRIMFPAHGSEQFKIRSQVLLCLQRAKYKVGEITES